MTNLGAITGISFTPDGCMVYGCTAPACHHALCGLHIGRLRVPILTARKRRLTRNDGATAESRSGTLGADNGTAPGDSASTLPKSEGLTDPAQACWEASLHGCF